MEGGKPGVFRLFVLMLGLTCAAMMLPEVEALRYIVGGNMGWGPNVNYTAWAEGKHFYNGDWLFFVYDRNQMNVLEVNLTGYESCNSDHFLHNWTTGAGRDVVPLNVTRTYYFISGKGFCFSGMKVAVNVENPPLPPSPSPTKSASNRTQQFPPLSAPHTAVPYLSFTPAPSPSEPGSFPAANPKSSIAPSSGAANPKSSIVPSSGAGLEFSPANGPSGSVSGSSSSCSFMNRLSCLSIIGFCLSLYYPSHCNLFV